MKIALLWQGPTRLCHITMLFEQYRQGLTSLGHHVTLITSADAAEGYSHPCERVADPAKFKSPAWWRNHKLDLVITPTWHRNGEILSALKTAKVTVIGIADSDGNVSYRLHAGHALERLLAGSPGPLAKLQTLRVFFHIWRRAPLHADKEALDSLALCDRLLLSWPLYQERFAAMAKHYGRGDLASRIGLAPYPVRPEFLSRKISDKKTHVIAVGRWEDSQKNASLLLKSLQLFTVKYPEAKVLILGSDTAKGDVATFARTNPTVEYRGVCDLNSTLDAFSKSRILLSTSRWESGPIVANEMLCLGGTVVGPHDTGFQNIASGGEFGETYAKRSPQLVFRALEKQWLEWKAGKYSPKSIAKQWRDRFSPAAIAEALLGEFSTSAAKKKSA